MTPQTHITIRDWLFDRLDASNSDGVEESLFVDADQADRIDEVQRDLIDAAAANQLDAADMAAMSSRFLSSRRGRTRWRVARALAQHRAQRPVRPERRWAVWSVAAAACLILCALGVMRPWQLSDATTPTISLRATAQRGLSATTIAMPRNSGNLRLQLDIGDAEAEHFTLRIAERGKILFEANGLAIRHAGRTRFVEAAIPTTDLGPGERHVSVAADGAADVATWDVTFTAP